MSLRLFQWIQNKLRVMKVLETGMAAIMLAFSGVLWVPGSTFATSHTYDVMAKALPEWLWALSCTIIGLCQLLGMAGNWPIPRSSGHLIATGFWFTIGTVFLNTNPLSTGWPTYYIIGCLTGYLYWKVGEHK